MKRVIWGLVVVVLVVALAGCVPADGGPPPTGQPTDVGVPLFTGPPDYMVLINAYDANPDALDEHELHLPLVCEIRGLDLHGRIVQITDTTTGKTGPYRLVVDNKLTPKRLLLYDYVGVSAISVTCTVFGEPGDWVMCEFVTGDGEHPAKLLRGDVQVNEVQPDDASAVCSGTIIARG